MEAAITLLPDFEVKGFGGLDQRLANIKAWHDRKIPEIEICRPRDEVLTVLAYGPSLKDTFPQVVQEVFAGNKVMTVSGAHDFLVDRGIAPDWHAEMDIRPRKAEFVRNSRPETEYLIASCCDPVFWDVLNGRRVKAWHLTDCSIMDEHFASLTGSAIMHPSAQCIGLNALILGHTLGFRTFSMHGFDCSYADGEPHPGWHNGTNDDGRRITVICGDKEFETRPEWVKYARNFIEEMLPRMPGCRFGIHGDGLLNAMIKEGQKEGFEA